MKTISAMLFSCWILTGCSGMDSEYAVGEYTLFPKAYVNQETFDSIYHYGFNQGCESALKLKGVADTTYMKDLTLTDSDTRYDEGWEDGKAACEHGLRSIMESSKIHAGSQSVNSMTVY
ncbi:hypothetical protein KCN56_08540 [Photobacterium galatheae]|uniref:hypothetical protein n=1 Tax=Photobacterium galatheae TaxID=1654360 RepID=UPI00202CBDFF|nr:hypothetical protein [Photobacterium galatheae]MCM0148607.1 hypothetical protein [Photobacterium galatheae]